ncbi:hypothetical protein [Salibacterium lacus]|uniref:Pilus assembly protein Flp/PilA n=1 Tax=Salibacterium lacus TaxID=1898109 RepID=A0ABW5T0N2_9BACI
MVSMYVKVQQFFRTYMDNEKGSVSLEWIMLGLLGVALVGMVVTSLNDMEGNNTIASAIIDKIAEFVESIGSGE